MKLSLPIIFHLFFYNYVHVAFSTKLQLPLAQKTQLSAAPNAEYYASI